MFRAAAPGPFDEAVAKATDENSTSEDWAAIIEVCDRVTADATNGPKEAVQSLIKRLAHRNANVQLYTLELANALSQNCGTPLHRELASRAFTDALLKLANDRNTHNLVRLKILERMKEWTEMFRSNTDLGIMQDAYGRLQQAQPQLQPPPSAPQKNSLTDLDRQREEEDLQRALKLSLEDETSKKVPIHATSSSAPAAGPSSAGPAAPAAAAEVPANAPAQTNSQTGSTAATVSRVRALFDFAASEPDELDFKKGDVIAVLESVYRDWWRGSLKGRTGIFPLNYVEILADPTPDELQREAQMEAEVFAEIKNVEKLLTLLSASNMAPREEDSDEISKLYHQTLAIRPKLIKLIEKYSQKKDDFTQLNEKFIKARRDYESLLESSMAHPPQPSYQQYAMRPQVPQQVPQVPQAPQVPQVAQPGYAAGPSSYAAVQPEQRYFSPAPRQEQVQYPQSPPPPSNLQRPGPSGTPAAFYINTKIQAPPPQQQPHHQHQPSHPPPHQHQHQQQHQHQHSQPQVPQQSPQHHPPQQQQQHAPQMPQLPQLPQLPQQLPPQQSPYPPQPHPSQRLPSGSISSITGGIQRQTSPPHTSFVTPPPATSTYIPYNPHQSAVPGGPHSTYGNPQELSTSAYDSPVSAPSVTNEPPSAPAVYSSPSYPTERIGSPSNVLSESPAPDVSSMQPLSQPSQPLSQPLSQSPVQSNGYSSYTNYTMQPSAPAAPQMPQVVAAAVAAAAAAAAAANANANANANVLSSSPTAEAAPPLPSSPPPPAPETAAPPAPSPATFYDARQTLPSMMGAHNPQTVPAVLAAPTGPPSAPSAPSAPSPPGSSGEQPQYRAYVPPSTSATGPNTDDYYRQRGRVGY